MNRPGQSRLQKQMQDTSLLTSQGIMKRKINPIILLSCKIENFSFFLFFFLLCSFCLDSSLNETKARGKVLVCQHSESSSESRLDKSLVVKKAGAVGMILIDENEEGLATPFVIPAATVGRAVGKKILSYANHTRCNSCI